MTKQQVVNYYDLSEWDYKFIWHLDSQMALHAGYWDKTTKNLKEALQKENEVLAKIAQIQKQDLVLDAGCGVGGSSIYLAKNFGCKAVGITLSQRQVKLARLNAKKHHVSDLVKFQKMDFTKTTFTGNTFDVVWAIESVFHTPEKQKFIKEAFRILKKRGRLILTDAFATKYEYNQARQMKAWMEGFGTGQTTTIPNFKKYLKETGFKKIFYKNITKNIFKSSRRLFILSFPAFIYNKIGQFLGRRTSLQMKNTVAAFSQYQALKKGLWQYGIFYAEK